MLGDTLVPTITYITPQCQCPALIYHSSCFPRTAGIRSLHLNRFNLLMWHMLFPMSHPWPASLPPCAACSSYCVVAPKRVVMSAWGGCILAVQYADVAQLRSAFPPPCTACLQDVVAMVREQSANAPMDAPVSLSLHPSLPPISSHDALPCNFYYSWCIRCLVLILQL